jgi:hypothetical protein
MMMRKPAAELEKFQQNRDADTSPVGAVSEKSLLGLVDRPMLDQLLIVPASFHRAVTCVMPKVTILPMPEHDEQILADDHMAAHDSFALIRPNGYAKLNPKPRHLSYVNGSTCEVVNTVSERLSVTYLPEIFVSVDHSIRPYPSAVFRRKIPQ